MGYVALPSTVVADGSRHRRRDGLSSLVPTLRVCGRRSVSATEVFGVSCPEVESVPAQPVCQGGYVCVLCMCVLVLSLKNIQKVQHKVLI